MEALLGQIHEEDTPQRIMLREVVKDGERFERVFTQSMAGSNPVWRDVQLLTYRYLDAKARQSDTITVRIPAMGREIIIALPPAERLMGADGRR